MRMVYANAFGRSILADIHDDVGSVGDILCCIESKGRRKDEMQGTFTKRYGI